MSTMFSHPRSSSNSRHRNISEDMVIASGHLINNSISPYNNKTIFKTRRTYISSNIWTSTSITTSRLISKTWSILITSSNRTSCSRPQTSRAILATTFCQRWLIINRSKSIINKTPTAILTLLSITIGRTALLTRSPNHTILAATSSIQIKTISLTRIKINESFYNICIICNKFQNSLNI